MRVLLTEEERKRRRVAYMASRYNSDKDDIKIEARRYRKEHREEINANAKKRREENPEKARVYNKFYYVNNKEELRIQNRVRYIKRTYGLTVDGFDSMLAAQGGVCSICKTDTPKGNGTWHIDHKHNTKKIRGLLCHSCNVMLGHAKEDVSILLSAIEYLKRFES